MAKSKNKRTRTVSVRQDYRKGGKVERAKKFTGGFNTVALGAMNRLNKESQAQIDELNQPAQPEPTFGAVPKGAKTGRPDIGMEPAPSQPVEVPTDKAAPIASPTPAAQPVVPTQPVVPIAQPDLSGTSRFGDFGAFGDYDRDQPPRDGEPEPDPGGGTPTPAPTPEPTPSPTPEPTPAPTPSPEEDALRSQVEAQARGEMPETITIPDALQIDDSIAQNVTVMPEPTSVSFEEAEGVPAETVSIINQIAQAQGPEEAKVSTIQEILKVPEDVAVKIAQGQIRPENLAEAIKVARVEAIPAATVEIEEGALMAAAQGELSAEAVAPIVENAGLTLARVTRAKKQLRNAGLSEEDITELGNDPEALEDRLTDFTEEQRGIIEGLPEDALVSNQIDSLLAGLESGEIPMWARPAVTSVEKMLAARGMSASTVGRDTLINTIIQSALPIAQSNAQAIQQSVAQQRGIEAQAFEADAQRRQQTALFNAGNVFQMDMANLNNEQQARLSNSKFLQTVSLTEANNRQQVAIQNAVLTSQANLAEANFAQQSQIQNAKNFLSMDLANLNAEQQSYMIEAQQEQQRILSNQSAENARRQFNATSEMQVEQFNNSLAVQVDQFNTQQTNAVKQFNATQQNAAAARDAQRQADVNKFNTQLKTQVAEFNANQDFARNQWNSQNRAAVEASNVQWRRQANTANTAAQNAINMQNAMNAFNMSQTALSFMWQELRDNADYDFRAGENEKSRIAQLVSTALASDPERYGSGLAAIENLIGIITEDI